MNQVPILIKREFWEHRNTFLVLPAVITVFFSLLLAGLFIFTENGGISAHIVIDGDNSSEEWSMDADDESMDEAMGIMFSKLPEMSVELREQKLFQVFHSLTLPFFMVMSFVVFFYLIGSLYEDRKDRSILFWKSMPVSNSKTVLIKLATALLAVPAVYLVCAFVVQVFFLLVVSIAAMGHDINVFEMLVAPSNLIGRFFIDIAYLLVQGVWTLPFYGWVLLVSAFAKSVPLIWCIGVPFAVTLVEKLFFSEAHLSEWLFRHATPPHYSMESPLEISDLSHHLLRLDTLIGVVVGAGLILGAIWLRGRGDEI